MGNQLIKNVEISKEIISNGGHQGFWSIYTGHWADMSEISVFTIEKKKWTNPKNKD